MYQKSLLESWSHMPPTKFHHLLRQVPAILFLSTSCWTFILEMLEVMSFIALHYSHVKWCSPSSSVGSNYVFHLQRCFFISSPNFCSWAIEELWSSSTNILLVSFASSINTTTYVNLSTRVHEIFSTIL